MDGNPPTFDAKLELNTPRIHMAMVSVIECSAITTALILAFENLYFSNLELFSSYTRDAIGLLLFITEPFPDLSKIFVGEAERIRHPQLRQVTILITLWGGVATLIYNLLLISKDKNMMSILYSENQSKIIVRDIDIAKSFGYFLCFLFVPVALFIFMGFPNFQLNLFLLKGFFIHDAAFKFVSTIIWLR